MDYYKRLKVKLPKLKNVEELALNIDVPLLVTLCKQQSPSYSKAQLEKRNFLKTWISQNIENVKTSIDSYGNLYVTKGKSKIYPCIVSHLDIVHDIRPLFQVCQSGNILFGFDNLTGEQTGVGGDDNCGIYICLELLRLCDKIKIVFTLDEEVGMIGAREVNLSFFKDCSFLGQPDRRSDTVDFINFTNGIQTCDEKFTDLITKELNEYGYKITRGLATDVGQLKYNPEVTIPAFNATNGSYREHRDNEIILLDFVRLSLNFFYDVIQKVGYKKHHYVSQIPVYPVTKYKSYDSLLDYNLCPACLTELTPLSKLSAECTSCNKKYWNIYN
jgi:hypothetical protein